MLEKLLTNKFSVLSNQQRLQVYFIFSFQYYTRVTELGWGIYPIWP